MTHKLYDIEELHNLQQHGIWPVADSSLLAEKYADRFVMAERLFKKINKDVFKELHKHKEYEIFDSCDTNIPHKSFSHHHSGECFSFDQDFMAGPDDWKKDNPIEFVKRHKIYIYDWTENNLQGSIEELDYFVEMHKDFKPVLEHYLHECYSDQADTWEKNLYKLMIIEYTNPYATDDNLVEHRKWNTERFGNEHCDETLGGLHLGENFVEFQAKNTKTHEWELINGLEENNMLWMFGEHAERSGWIPTYHGMTHNSSPEHKNRYSIIFDLQARYNGEQ